MVTIVPNKIDLYKIESLCGKQRRDHFLNLIFHRAINKISKNLNMAQNNLFVAMNQMTF